MDSVFNANLSDWEGNFAAFSWKNFVATLSTKAWFVRQMSLKCISFYTKFFSTVFGFEFTCFFKPTSVWFQMSSVCASSLPNDGELFSSSWQASTTTSKRSLQLVMIVSNLIRAQILISKKLKAPNSKNFSNLSRGTRLLKDRLNSTSLESL